MYYNTIMEKKVGNNMNNIHHYYNPKSILKNKASTQCKYKRKHRKKQSWVIDKNIRLTI